MTNQDLTEIVCILDRSGSMGGVVNDTIGASRSVSADAAQMDWSADARASVTGDDPNLAPVAGTIDKP